MQGEVRNEFHEELQNSFLAVQGLDFKWICSFSRKDQSQNLLGKDWLITDRSSALNGISFFQAIICRDNINYFAFLPLQSSSQDLATKIAANCKRLEPFFP